MEVVDNAGDKRRFGPRDEEIDIVLPSELGERGEVFLRDVGNVLGDCGGGGGGGGGREQRGAAVAGADVDVRDEGGLGEFPREGVFAAAVAHEEDAEGGFSTHCAFAIRLFVRCRWCNCSDGTTSAVMFAAQLE